MHDDNTLIKKDNEGLVTDITEGTPSVYKKDGKWYKAMTHEEVQVDEANFGEWMRMNSKKVN